MTTTEGLFQIIKQRTENNKIIFTMRNTKTREYVTVEAPVREDQHRLHAFYHTLKPGTLVSMEYTIKTNAENKNAVLTAKNIFKRERRKKNAQ